MIRGAAQRVDGLKAVFQCPVDGRAGFAAYVDVVADAADMVTPADVALYLGDSSWTEAEIENASKASAPASNGGAAAGNANADR